MTSSDLQRARHAQPDQRGLDAIDREGAARRARHAFPFTRHDAAERRRRSRASGGRPRHRRRGTTTALSSMTIRERCSGLRCAGSMQLCAPARQRRMARDQHAVFEDADLVGQAMHVEHAAARGVGHAVGLPPTLTMPSCETRRSSFSTAR